MTNPTPTSGAADLPEALTEDQWLGLAIRHANKDWNSAQPDGYANAVKALCTDFAALTAQALSEATDHIADLGNMVAQAISAEPAAHVQNPAENEHVADDMSKNETGSNISAQQPAPAGAMLFDEQGFRDWVLRNLPKGSVIGNGEWWADHLTAWAKRFVKSAPQPSPTAQAAPAATTPSGKTYEVLIHDLEVIASTTLHATVEGSRRSYERDAVRQAIGVIRASHGQAPAPTNEQIAAYLLATGAYVTNDATREAAIAEAIDADRAKRGQAPALHPKTSDLVQRFAAALAEKLAAAEKKYGYSDGWASPNWMDECRQHLNAHIVKGDPRDVAAYCAFLWHHGATTVSPQAEQQALAGSEIYVCARECSNCGHAGINDDHADNDACKACDWSGPSPEKDHCPDCGKDGTMTAACPMCSGVYVLVAEANIPTPTPQAADTGAAQGVPADVVDSLHDEIMRLPCKPNSVWYAGEQEAYRLGHRDARHAAAELAAAQPAPPADSVQAPVLDGGRSELDVAISVMNARDASYPPLPDFDAIEQHIYGACRRYISSDMLQPIHNLIRDAIDADRAARAPADSVTAPGGGVVESILAAARSQLSQMRAQRKSLEGFLALGNEVSRAALLDEEIQLLAGALDATQAAESVLEDAAQRESHAD